MSAASQRYPKVDSMMANVKFLLQNKTTSWLSGCCWFWFGGGGDTPLRLDEGLLLKIVNVQNAICKIRAGHYHSTEDNIQVLNCSNYHFYFYMKGGTGRL